MSQATSSLILIISMMQYDNRDHRIQFMKGFEHRDTIPPLLSHHTLLILHFNSIEPILETLITI